MTATPRLNGKTYCELLTLDRILTERCEEEGECWVWTGSFGGAKKTRPTVYFRGQVVAAYLATYLLDRGLLSVPEGLLLWRGCMNLQCVNPQHIKAGTKAQKVDHLKKMGAFKCSPTRKAMVTVAARKSRSKLAGGMEEARLIRSSEKSEAELSKDHGISISRVNRIRNGKAWRESVIPAASIFSMAEAT